MAGARVVRFIVFAAGSVGGLSGAAYGLLNGQSRRARGVAGGPAVLPLNADGVYHPDGSGPHLEPGSRPVTLAVLGDSLAAGIGAETTDGLPGVLLAKGLAEEGAAPVRLTTHAISGAKTFDLPAQVDRALIAPPELALVIIGGNDVTARARIATSAMVLGREVRRLTAAGTNVVVATCPDLGVARCIPQPLRELARHYGRALSRAQHRVLDRIGTAAVSLFDLVSPEFMVRPHELFSPDRFHPNGAGYRIAADALLPALCGAAGLFTGRRPMLTEPLAA
ncbi:MAG: SGNH/GDSL hydrolase family protein [Labedaea sp.]